MNMKSAFLAAIAANDKAAFMAAAERYGVKPSAVLPYASCDGVYASRDGFQVFVESVAAFDATPEGVHDGFRRGASHMTRKAETLAFLVSQLASCTPHEMYTSSAVYRTGQDSWVFVSSEGVASDPVSESEVQWLVEQNRLPYSEFLRLKNLELEQFTV